MAHLDVIIQHSQIVLRGDDNGAYVGTLGWAFSDREGRAARILSSPIELDLHNFAFYFVSQCLVAGPLLGHKGATPCLGTTIPFFWPKL